jgi:hypothetical protein
MAANVGGPVVETCKTFDVDMPEVEAYLSCPDRDQYGNWTYTTRMVIGVEVLTTPEVTRECRRLRANAGIMVDSTEGES